MEARRQEILLAMAEVLAHKGYDATTLDDVAERMNSSKAVIYYQFRSKEELYVELTRQVLETAAERLSEIIARAEPPGVQLEEAVRDLVRMGFRPLHYATLRTGRPGSLQESSRVLLRSLDRQYEALFMDIVSRGMDAGVIERRDTHLVTFTLINAAHSVFKWFQPGKALSPELLEKEVPAMLLEGVLVR
jgi:TetR/AcrR family transcriptional regulator, cholesterol catabolism regulator